MKAASFVSEQSGLSASAMLPISDDRRLSMADQLRLFSEGSSPTSSAADLDEFSGIRTTVRGGSSVAELGESAGIRDGVGGEGEVAADAAAAVRDVSSGHSAVTTSLTGTWETVTSNIATRGNTFAMDGGTLIVAGSTNPTSDRDLTFVAKPTTGDMTIKTGATQLADTKLFWSQQWVSASQDETPVVLSSVPDPGVRTTPLSNDERSNTMKALQKSGSNWFTAIEKYSKDPTNDPTMLRNLRALEVEFTHSMSTAIMSNYDNVSEADFVKLINQGSQDVFGKELGTMFDTNIYTAHSILKFGVVISNPEAKAQLLDANATKGLMKVAKNIIALQHGDISAGKTAFDVLAERACEGLSDTKVAVVRDQFTKAFEGALVQATAIKDKMVDLRSELTAEFDSIRIELSTASPADRPALAAKLESVGQVLRNESELEMVAMNRLYETKLEDAQARFNEMGAIEDGVQRHISGAIGDNPELAAGLLSNFQKGDFDAIATLLSSNGVEFDAADLLLDQLSAIHSSYEESVVASVSAQMEALVYANEPYYSQATVDGVVGGIQIDKVHESVGTDGFGAKMEALGEKFPVLKEPETWGSSMQENFGDFVKDKHHYETKPGDFLFKGSKYLFRMAFSAEVALTMKSVPADDEKAQALKTQVTILREVAADLQVVRGSSQSGSEKTEACKARLIRSATELGLEMTADTSLKDVAEGLYKLSEQVMVDCSVLLNK
jgi:hypothetical protein